MYQDKIGEYTPLTIDNIIHIAETDIPQRFRSMPWAYSDAEGRTLEHGTAILETEELCSAYIAAYGRMHREKLYFALDGAKEKGNFPYRELHNGVELFDWGCGQGIGSMAVIENLKKGFPALVVKVSGFITVPQTVTDSASRFNASTRYCGFFEILPIIGILTFMLIRRVLPCARVILCTLTTGTSVSEPSR